MERDCMIAHGAVSMLRERLCTQSDNYRIQVCRGCGLIVYKNPKTGNTFCNTCKRTTPGIDELGVPYVCKLLFHELMAMNIIPRIVAN